MRRFTLHVSTAVIAAAIGFPGAASAESIQWAPDLDVARATASVQGKLLLLHFWTPDCAPCKQLEQTVFPNEFVAQALNKHYVPLKVNAFRNPELRNHFRVDRWPTDIIATTDGKVVHRMVTPQEADRYVHELMTAASKHAASKGKPSPQTPDIQQQAADPAAAYRSRWAQQHGDLMPAVETSTAQAQSPGVNYEGDQNFASQNFASRAARPGLGWDPAKSQMPINTVTEAPSASRFNPQREVVNPYIQQQAAAETLPTPAPAAPTSPTTQAGASRFEPATKQEPALAKATTPIIETPPVGLDGRCPVTLIRQGSWKEGDAQWGAIHRGRLYLFAGRQEQQTFLANPDQYSPVLAGMDVVRLAEVGKVVQGDREYGVLFDDDGKGPNASRIYLFDSAESRNRFEATPDVYLQPVMEALRRNALHTMLR